MKKFIIKILIFFTIIGTPLLIVNQMYKSTNYYLSMNELYWLKVYPQNIEILTLGNSHEMAGIRFYNNYKGVAHNFATSSQPFYYDYQVLKNIKDSVKDDAVVLIPISLFDWYYNYMEIFKEDDFSYNKRYYSLLPPTSMYNYDFEDDVKYNYLPVLTAKENLKYIKNDVELPQLKWGDYSSNKQYVENSAWSVYEIWSNNVMKHDEKIKEDNIKWFKKTIDYCYEKGYKPVVIMTPIPYTLTEKFSKDFINEIYKINRDVMSDYPDTLVLDYSKDTELTNKLEYYSNGDHLNTSGANAYTKKLLNDLEKFGYISSDKIV